MSEGRFIDVRFLLNTTVAKLRQYIEELKFKTYVCNTLQALNNNFVGYYGGVKLQTTFNEFCFGGSVSVNKKPEKIIDELSDKTGLKIIY